MSELLPCPFCGTSEQSPTGLVNVTLGQVAMVECRRCGTLTRAATWASRYTPPDWQLVPVEPTREMKVAADIDTPGPMTAWKCWQVMLAAAPSPDDRNA